MAGQWAVREGISACTGCIGLQLGFLAASFLALTGFVYDRPYPHVNQVEIHRSAPQILVLRNTSSVPVRLYASDRDSTASLIVSPGADKRFEFTVVTVIDGASKNGVAVPGSGNVPSQPVNYVVEPMEPFFLQPQSVDILLGVEPDGEDRRTMRLTLYGCSSRHWAEAPAPRAFHYVNISQVRYGFPAVLCPEGLP